MAITVANVKHAAYGAAGDGVTNDTAAITAAFTAVSGAGGGLVYFPRGTYKITEILELPSLVSVRGVNAKIAGALPNESLLRPAGHNTIYGMEFTNTDTTTGNGAIDIGQNATDVKVLYCKFSGSIKTQAVNVNKTGISDLLVQGCTFDGVGYGVLFNPLSNDITGVRIIGNTFRNCYTEGIALNFPGAAGVGVASPYEGGDHFVIADNIISVPDRVSPTVNAGLGISLAGVNYATVANNIITEAYYQGIHVEDESKHVSITGNVIRNVRTADGGMVGRGIYVLDGDFISIVGNQVYDCEGKGIWLDYDPGNQANQAVISGNVVTGCGDVGIVTSGNDSGHDIIVTDNIVVNNTSHGIELRGSGWPVTVDGNTCRGNGGYGLRVESGRSGLILGQNQLVGNTSGDLVLAAAGLPLMLRGRRAMPTAVTDGGDTPWVNAFSLGLAASGQLAVEAFWVTNATDRAARLYDIVWDGTTLTATSRGSYINNSMGAISVQAASGNLQVAVLYDNSGKTVQFDVQFAGMMMQGA